MKITVKSLRPIRDHIIATDMVFKERLTQSGIYIPELDGKLEGIYPRWAKVLSVGPEQADVIPGDWVLVEHGRWSRGHTVTLDTGEDLLIRRIDGPGIMLVSKEKMIDESVGSGL